MPVTRRELLRSVGACAGAAMSSWRANAQGPTTARKPNVLFIAVDDLNDWIGCLGGNPDVRTPNFDRLAAQGMLFTNAHCAAPLCNPSRAALMTGILPSVSGVYDNPQPWRKAPALANAVTIPQYFRQHGYAVMGSGKIFHDSYPDPASWDEYFPALNKQKVADPLPPKRPLHGIANQNHFDWGPIQVEDQAMGDFQTVDWVSAKLAEQREKPLFLACGLYKPHLPWYVPEKYFALYDPAKLTLPKVNGDDLDDVPAVGKQMAKPNGDHRVVTENNQWRKAVQGYLASISFADAQLGRLLDAFEKSPRADETIVILWSDHGWHLGEKLHWRKFSLWEEATKNVLMVGGTYVTKQGLTKAGSRCGRPVSLMDIYPTLLDLCGLPPRKEIAGTSLRPFLKNPKHPRPEPALTTYRRGNHSLRDERWRYIRYHDGSEELYDHQHDPMEWKNLAGDPKYIAVKQRLQKWLPAYDAPESERGKDVEPA